MTIELKERVEANKAIIHGVIPRLEEHAKRALKEFNASSQSDKDLDELIEHIEADRRDFKALTTACYEQLDLEEIELSRREHAHRQNRLDEEEEEPDEDDESASSDANSADDDTDEATEPSSDESDATQPAPQQRHPAPQEEATQQEEENEKPGLFKRLGSAIKEALGLKKAEPSNDAPKSANLKSNNQ